MPSQNPHIAQELLSHQSFLRRLAVDLAGEEADDLVQEVWRRALEHPPHHGRQLRGWLARIARNLAADRWRGEARRRSREEHRSSEQPTREELEARLELRKELVGALDSLGPSQREAILLRYFEGLAPRDIAERQRVPVTTVKKRLQRGLGQLREALDRRYGGDRASWMSAVTALAVPVHRAVGTGSILIGGTAMGTMMKVSAAVLVGVACVYIAMRTPQSESPHTATVEPPAIDVELDEPQGAELVSTVEGPAKAAGRRSLSTEEAPADVAATRGTKVLRVIVEGITAQDARKATVTVTGVKTSNERRATIQDTWPCEGLTSEIDLGPFFARLAEQPGELRDDELMVVVDHPLHFSEWTGVALSSGVELSSGQTVYEVSVRFAEVIYWPEFTLEVRDATTRAHLEGVELRCAPTGYMGLVQQPGADGPFTVIGAGLSSPIGMRGGRKASEPEGQAAGMALTRAAGEALQPAELAQPEDTGRGVMMYARAPGYAWARLVLDVSKGTKRELLLQPGAALSIRLANVQLERYAALGKRGTLFVRRTQPDGEETTVWSRDLDKIQAAETLRIEALEPGEYAVLVELSGSWQRKPAELGRETVSIPAGEARELLLVVPDPPKVPAKATLGGFVSFPNFGGEESVRLELYRSDYRYGDPDYGLALAELEPVAGALPTWSFRIEELPADRYQIRLLPFLKSWVVELPEGGRLDVELVIPELAEVFVETVDAQTGQRIPFDAIAYRTLEVLPDQVTHGGSSPWQPVELEDEPGRFRFWAAPGAAAVNIWGSAGDVEYGRHPKEVELVPGLQSLRLELAPSCKFRFEFRVDGAPLPHEDGIFVGLSRCIHAVGHDGRVGGLYPYSFVEASAPGLYEISFEGVGADRFLPIAPRRVEVSAGETKDVIVELRRK
ncbi:MAG: RNA polymerase sigma factor [Planctomycetota bacterium]